MNTGVQVSAALAQLTGQVVCMQHGVNGQGYYTSLYHLRFISKNIHCLAAIGVEWRFVHKVGITKIMLA